MLVRVDTGFGRGHHDHVRTAGVHSKFGVPLFELDELERAGRGGRRARRRAARPHRQRRVRRAQLAPRSAELLGELAPALPASVRALDLGGGLGVPEKPGQAPVDLAALQGVIDDLRARWPQLELWLEPGRFLVAQAGVLLAQVTQLKGKGDGAVRRRRRPA